MDKATWDGPTVVAFIEVCVDEIIASGKPGTHFQRVGWKNVITKFNQKTSKCWTYKQLKNKWDNLKKDWQLWCKLVGNETGLGINPTTGAITASSEWWQQKLKGIPDAKKFHTRPLEHKDKLDIMFRDTFATGEDAWAPSTGVMLNQESERHMDHVDTYAESEDDSGDPNPESVPADFDAESSRDMQRTQEKGKRRSEDASSDQRKKGKKGGAAAKIHKSLERLCDAVQSRSSVTSKRSDPPGCSIQESIDALRNNPEIPRGSELFLFSVEYLRKAENREVFIALRDADLQYALLARAKSLQPTPSTS